MSDNAFGIQPEQEMADLGYATRLSALERYEQELRDRKQAEADREKAYDDSLRAKERFVDVLSWVEDQPDSPLQQFCEEFVERHRPSEWDGERFYYPRCGVCLSPCWDGAEPDDWPCDELKALERFMHEYR